jgi:hypothetical protein
MGRIVVTEFISLAGDIAAPARGYSPRPPTRHDCSCPRRPLSVTASRSRSTRVADQRMTTEPVGAHHK